MEFLSQVRRSGPTAPRLRQLRILPRANRDQDRRKLNLPYYLGMLKVAVDAMGGDHAPEAVVEGALWAAQEFGIDLLLVGDRGYRGARISASSETIVLDTSCPCGSNHRHGRSPKLRAEKKDSSMKIAFEVMKRGEAQAVVSAGNSGAMMATGMFVMGRLPLVARPAILIVVPSLSRGTVIIDAGANVDCKPHHLVQFAFMGGVYAEKVQGIAPSPHRDP